MGTLTLLTSGEDAFDGHTVAPAEGLARRAASAAVNARQYTQRVALARDLQAGLLLPEVPAVPGADIAPPHYHPAGEGLGIGGDFYDVFPLAGDRWAFMVGDVCGRGAMAAITTALVRHTARAVAPLVPGPEAVVDAVNRALLNRDGELLGEERLADALPLDRPAARDVIDAVIETVRAFTGGRHGDDDQAILVLPSTPR
ncbi:SpoIIE family protein phosphatase [Streptomyces sp. NPDC007084]|uniref:PP2C family protein-serine/threonine phosphatase n=1 Tax=Streptomyces sp. NPDC007084 TaxID=3154313 RepID=UPI0034528EE4